MTSRRYRGLEARARGGGWLLVAAARVLRGYGWVIVRSCLLMSLLCLGCSPQEAEPGRAAPTPSPEEPGATPATVTVESIRSDIEEILYPGAPEEVIEALLKQRQWPYDYSPIGNFYQSLVTHVDSSGRKRWFRVEILLHPGKRYKSVRVSESFVHP